jgi:hypothetical protein
MLLSILCLGWLLLAAWGAAQYRAATHFGPVLHAPLAIAVDPADGTIYCASGAGRVQKYGADGRGRGAFPVETGGEPFRIVADAPGRIALAVRGDERVIVFDEGGRAVDERVQPGAFEAWAESAHTARAGDREIVLRAGAIIELGAGEERVLVPAIAFPLTFFAAAPWLLVLSLFCSTLGMMAAFMWPFLARPDDDTVR